MLKIISSDQNLQEWANTSIQKVEEQIEPLQKRVTELSQLEAAINKEPDSKEKDRRKRQTADEQARAESKLESLRKSLYHFHLAKKYIDMLVPVDRFQTLAMIIGLVVLAMILKGIFEFCQESLVGSVVNKSLYDMRNLFFRKVLHLDVNHFSQSGTHELMARFTNDVEMLGTGIKTLFGRVVAEPLRAIACVAVACWISWQLTLMFLVLVPFGLYILMRAGRLMKQATRRQLEHMSAIYKILQETFLGIRLVKAFTRESMERRRFHSATKEYYHKAMRVVYIDALAGPSIEVLGVAGVGLALLAGAYLVLNRARHLFGIPMTDQPLEAESLLTLYALLAAIAEPVRKLSSVFTRIQAGSAAADRVFKYMDLPSKVTSNTTGISLERHHESIEFRDVCFSYDPGHPILTDVHLRVEFGETIALVGKNGCGKSTMVGLLTRFFDPDHGCVLIDGIDIRSANLRSLRQQVSIVTQDAFLFDNTIFKNIAYGRKGVSLEEVQEVARKVRAHDFILKQPHGYETRIGEAGGKLSGGQKQRLTLARAMLRNPSILILDEFTSQADAEAEAEVHRHAARIQPQSHHLRHHPPPQHAGSGRPHRRARSWPSRRRRQAPGTAGIVPALSATARGAFSENGCVSERSFAVFGPKALQRIGLAALAVIALIALAAVLELVIGGRNQVSPIPEIKEYSVCYVSISEKGKDVSIQHSQRLLGLCNKILEKGERLSNASQDKYFHYNGSEVVTFFADSGKNEIVCKIEFWTLFPKHARVTTAGQRYYLSVPDELYYALREEAKSPEP